MMETELKQGDRVYGEWRGERHYGTVVHVEEWDDECLADALAAGEECEQYVIVDYDYGESVVVDASRVAKGDR